MSSNYQFQLECTNILQVPLHTYPNDFTFIVNNEEFKTSFLISDLLSPIISQIHSIDPTFDTFRINTENHGDFSHFLRLINFESNEIPEIEYPFILEILSILGNNKIKIDGESKKDLTKENVITKLRNHEKYHDYINSKLYEQEIEYITSHFNEILNTQKEELMNLQIETLERLFNHKNLTLETEDELLTFVNELYEHDSAYSILYEKVYFKNVTSTKMKEFIELFQIEDITNETWNRLCERLELETTKKSDNRKERYRNSLKKKIFSIEENNQFSGIINYLRNKSNNNIDNEIQVTSSSNYHNSVTSTNHPRTVAFKENPNNCFMTNDIENSWLEIDFKENRIIPTGYTLRSFGTFKNWDHPKSWAAEVSNDKNNWSVVDDVKNCSELNGERLVHTFKIQNVQSKEFRYFRIRLTDRDWNDRFILAFETIEIFGTLIEK